MPSTSLMVKGAASPWPWEFPSYPIQMPPWASRNGRRQLTSPPTGRLRLSSTLEGVNTAGVLLETTTTRPSPPMIASNTLVRNRYGGAKNATAVRAFAPILLLGIDARKLICRVSNRPADSVAFRSGVREFSGYLQEAALATHSATVEDSKALKRGVSGSAGRIRTCDQSVNSRPLYH